MTESPFPPSEPPRYEPPGQQPPGGGFPPPAGGQFGSPQFGSPQFGASQFGAPQTGYPAPPSRPRPNNNLVIAILSTVLCCLPAGIVAIVQAGKVNGLYDTGRYAEAQAAADQAKKWSIISAVAAVVVGVLYLGFVVLVSSSGSLAP